jgi:hypothetical protein
VDNLRSWGIVLPLHFNYWWGSIGILTPPDDPLDRVSIGHHIYGDQNSDTSYMRSGETWLQYCTRIGLEDREKKMFTSTDQTWFGYALSHGTKVMITEMGGSNNEVMTPYNVAFVIRTLEYAKMYGVGMIGFRVGDQGNLQTYENKAQQYFNRSLFEADSPNPNPSPGALLADINKDGVVNLLDALEVSLAYYTTPSDAKWNARADIAEPYGIIDLMDFIAVTLHYGETIG